MNYLPAAPEKIGTKFRLFTNRRDEDVREYISYDDDDSILKSKFNKLYPVKIVIHGFQNDGDTPWYAKKYFTCIKLAVICYY